MTSDDPRLSRNTIPRRGTISVVGGDGAVIRDAAGREWLDLSSQTVNLLFGQSHPFITERVIGQLRDYTFVDQDFDCPRDRMAIKRLRPLLPPNLTSFNIRMCNGSDAVECAVKQARRATGRSRVLTVDGIYLGQTTQVIHFRGLGERPSDILRGSTEDVLFAPTPYCDDHGHDPLECPTENGELTAELIARHHRELACVLVDPVLLSKGVFLGRAMSAFVTTVAAACREFGVPLVLDECQSFGWVPGNTLSTLWQVRPDALVLAKGVAGGFPLSVCATTAELDNLNWGEADYTNGGHPVAVAAMDATCELLADPAQQRDFGELCSVLDEHLPPATGTHARSRGIGMVRAWEILSDGVPADPAYVRHISDACLDAGVYVRPYGSALGIKPPRSITADQLAKALHTIGRVVDETRGH
ncbi:aminotransferase class III-fold pyridoxal phosphate-dependent enzyme [Amycolatopsis sp. NPDC058340]|uniref:aminotransferase class III-fold pyridoxal phosphate-dependent enzyme n=1 Tax=Amycolatopsis sp. NPDC058340 TaxID=3346453 RepID=UPI00364B6103